MTVGYLNCHNIFYALVLLFGKKMAHLTQLHSGVFKGFEPACIRITIQKKGLVSFLPSLHITLFNQYESVTQILSISFRKSDFLLVSRLDSFDVLNFFHKDSMTDL